MNITAKLVRGSNPDDSETFHTLIGGDTDNPSWEEYLDSFKEEYQPHIKAIRKCIEESGIKGAKANGYANHYYFGCSDGTAFAFSWRAWGDLMQAVVNKNEGYMAYYM